MQSYGGMVKIVQRTTSNNNVYLSVQLPLSLLCQTCLAELSPPAHAQPLWLAPPPCPSP